MTKTDKLKDKIRGIIYVKYGEDLKATDCAQEILKLLFDMKMGFIVEKELPAYADVLKDAPKYLRETKIETPRDLFILTKGSYETQQDMLKQGWRYVEPLEVKP